MLEWLPSNPLPPIPADLQLLEFCSAVYLFGFECQRLLSHNSPYPKWMAANSQFFFYFSQIIKKIFLLAIKGLNYLNMNDNHFFFNFRETQ